MPACLRLRATSDAASGKNGLTLAMVASVITSASVPTTTADATPAEEVEVTSSQPAEETEAGEGEGEDKADKFDMKAFLEMLRGKPISEEQVLTSLALGAAKEQSDVLEAELAALRTPALNAFIANEPANPEEAEKTCAEIVSLLHAEEQKPAELKTQVEALYKDFQEQAKTALEVGEKKELTEAEIRELLVRVDLRDRIAACRTKMTSIGAKWHREMMGVYKEDRAALIEALPVLKGLMPEDSPYDNFANMGGDAAGEDHSAGSEEASGSVAGSKAVADSKAEVADESKAEAAVAA